MCMSIYILIFQLFHTGSLYRSEGCHTTELLLSCPPGTMLVTQAASFAVSDTKLNCSARTQHSQPSRS